MLQNESIRTLLESFSPISLTDMSSVKLMNRTDTKFVASQQMLEQFLRQMAGRYSVQETAGHRIGSYHTVYLDTPDCQMYLAHHNRRLTRQKIRIREYVDTQTFFFEIKNKNNHGRTRKKRIPTDGFGIGQNGGLSRIPSTNPAFEQFFLRHSRYPFESLSPALENRFQRITLVNQTMTERITIDINLKFNNLRTGQTADLSPLIIIELKQDGLNSSKETRRILDACRIKPFRISKYCIGSALTDPRLKQNNFKQKIRTLQKIAS